MDPQEALVRFVVGGTLITAVSLLGETRYGVFSGLAVLFPIVTLTGYYFLSLEVPVAQVREVALASALGVPTVLAFVLGFYAATTRFSVPVSLALGVACWFAAAALVLAVDLRTFGLFDLPA